MDERYEQLGDKVVAPMTPEERAYLLRLLDRPTSEFKRLALRLHDDGCEFPRQQAAMMLRSALGAAYVREATHVHSYPLSTGVCECGAAHPVLGPWTPEAA